MYHMTDLTVCKQSKRKPQNNEKTNTTRFTFGLEQTLKQ